MDQLIGKKVVIIHPHEEQGGVVARGIVKRVDVTRFGALVVLHDQQTAYPRAWAKIED